MKSHLFIDVLVRSSKSKLHTLQFIDDHVLIQIEQLCSVLQVGCQGIALVRRVLPAKAVEVLLLCKDRKHQVMLVEDLKQDLLATNLDTSYVHTWKEVSNVEEYNVNFFGGGMEDTTISLLGQVDTYKVFQRQHKTLEELESQVTKLQENKTYFETYRQDFQNEIKMDSFNTNHVQQHIDFKNNGDVTLPHLVECICYAILPEIKDELHLVAKNLMEGIKEEIQSKESKLHNMLRMELDNMISLLMQLQQ